MATTTYARHGAPDYASRTAAGCEAAGEPVFLLRAQDVLAPATVRAWADFLEGHPTRTGIPNAQMAEEARRIADAMEAWPDRKEPD